MCLSHVCKEQDQIAKGVSCRNLCVLKGNGTHVEVTTLS